MSNHLRNLNRGLQNRVVRLSVFATYEWTRVLSMNSSKWGRKQSPWLASNTFIVVKFGACNWKTGEKRSICNHSFGSSRWNVSHRVMLPAPLSVSPTALRLERVSSPPLMSMVQNLVWRSRSFWVVTRTVLALIEIFSNRSPLRRMHALWYASAASMSRLVQCPCKTSWIVFQRHGVLTMKLCQLFDTSNRSRIRGWSSSKASRKISTTSSSGRLLMWFAPLTPDFGKETAREFSRCDSASHWEECLRWIQWIGHWRIRTRMGALSPSDYIVDIKNEKKVKARFTRLVFLVCVLDFRNNQK